MDTALKIFSLILISLGGSLFVNVWIYGVDLPIKELVIEEIISRANDSALKSVVEDYIFMNRILRLGSLIGLVSIILGVVIYGYFLCR